MPSPIFDVTPNAVPRQVTPPVGDGPSGEPKYFTKDEARQAFHDATNVDQAEAKNTLNADGTPINPAQKEEPMIIVDGPLGRIYTQALKMALANEDTGTMAVIIGEGRRAREAEQGGPKGTHVLALDMDNLDGAALLQTSDWLGQSAKDGGAMIISLESHGNISSKSGLVEELAKAHGAKVYYSRESCMNAVKKAVKASVAAA